MAGLLEELGSWLVAAGGAVEGCAFASSGDGERGVFATRDLSEGDLILSVPARLIVTGGGSRFEALPEADRLALRLLDEVDRGEASAWRAWLLTLPEAPNVPLLWPAKEATNGLRCPVLTERVRAHRAALSRRYAAARDAMLPRALDRGRYLWAIATLESRGVYMSGACGADEWAVVPVGDLFNHAADANVAAALEGAAVARRPRRRGPLLAGSARLARGACLRRRRAVVAAACGAPSEAYVGDGACGGRGVLHLGGRAVAGGTERGEGVAGGESHAGGARAALAGT